MILLIGVFASFSRAAWGIDGGLGDRCVLPAVFFLEAKARERFRMMLLAICGALAIVVAIGGLLSIPSVQELFDIRATDQAYDEGESGRFGRQGYAFDLALNHPWGLGPLEFSKLRIVEEPHNIVCDDASRLWLGRRVLLHLLIAHRRLAWAKRATRDRRPTDCC